MAQNIHYVAPTPIFHKPIFPWIYIRYANPLRQRMSTRCANPCQPVVPPVANVPCPDGGRGRGQQIFRTFHFSVRRNKDHTEESYNLVSISLRHSDFWDPKDAGFDLGTRILGFATGIEDV